VTTTLGQIIIALMLLAAGGLVRQAARVERQLAGAETRLATLQPDAADSEYAGVVEALGPAADLPVLGTALVADIQEARAKIAYWRGDYASVPSQEAELTDPGTSPDLVFLAANAKFRTVVGRRSGQEGAQDLDGVLRVYTMLLKRDPSHQDGAFNYEYVVRLRNIVARTRPRSGDAQGAAGSKSQPPPPSVHGDQGAPPSDDTSDSFNVIVPLRPEERGELMKAGSGAARQRKG